MSLTFAHTPSYPDEPPLLRVRRCAPERRGRFVSRCLVLTHTLPGVCSVRGVSKADAEELQRVLEQQVRPWQPCTRLRLASHPRVHAASGV